MATSAHLVLLGDSILDNGAYTRGEPDVLGHLQPRLPRNWRASLAAVDGSTTADLSRQLARVPREATHLVIAIGGNDALSNRDLLATPRLARVALMMFNDVILRTAFERGLSVIDLRLVCTEQEDYANPIEPSGQGGRKIADAIARAVGISESGAVASHVYSDSGK